MSRSRLHLAHLSFSARLARIALGLCALLAVGQLAAVAPASAAPVVVAPVPLGAAGSYAVLAGTNVTNTGVTTLTGDLGLNGLLSGAGTLTVTGPTNNANSDAATAQAARQVAYDNAAGRAGGLSFTGDQNGKLFEAGVHTTSAAFTSTGTITLDGGNNPNAVFIFQVNGAYSPGANFNVVLINQAQGANVFWQVNGALTLPAASTYPGIFLVNGAATVGAGAVLNGRLLGNGPVTLDANTINGGADTSPPLVTIDGGASRATNDLTPTISGTTDEPVGRTVTVTVDTQTLTTTVIAGGLWQVTATALAAGTYPVTASVTDLALNTGTATQALTIDVTAPTIMIDGPASVTTNDSTPTISGITDEPVGSTVTVTVGGQTLIALVTAPNVGEVTPTALASGNYVATATVVDDAGNSATDSVALTVDLVAPVVTLAGGSTLTTNDSTPTISGTTDEPVGRNVTVTVNGQVLTAPVTAGGFWQVTAGFLADGTYTVLARVRIRRKLGQRHTIAHDHGHHHISTHSRALHRHHGGSSRSTADTTPTISGTTSEAVGSVVTITVGASQTLTATVISGGRGRRRPRRSRPATTWYGLRWSVGESPTRRPNC